MRKILSCLVLIVLLLSIPFVISAQTKPEGLSAETVITEDNIEDILNYFGIDPSNVVKMDETIEYDVTVRDLQKAIEEFKQLPKTITTVFTHEIDFSANKQTDPGSMIFPMSYEYGNKTVIRDIEYGSYTMRYTATGGYYIEYAPVFFSTWTFVFLIL